MGLYDRDYGRKERTAWDRIESPRSMTITLIVINVIVFVAQLVFVADVKDPSTGQAIRDPATGDLIQCSQLSEWFSVSGESLTQPWKIWQTLTYGFLHDFKSPMHILFNMFGLFVFGRIVEQRIGPMEFLKFYLLAIVAGGFIGAITDLIGQYAMGQPPTGTIGASGAVVAVTILFACYFPHQQIFLMMVFPIKAWIAAILFVAFDLAGALGITSGGAGANTAFTVHLAGAAFAAAYFYQRWNLNWLAIESIGDLPNQMRKRATRAKLKIHDPDRKIARDAEEADRILDKIHQSGESSLTGAERKVLQRYSRRQREKRDG